MSALDVRSCDRWCDVSAAANLALHGERRDNPACACHMCAAARVDRARADAKRKRLTR